MVAETAIAADGDLRVGAGSGGEQGDLVGTRGVVVVGHDVAVDQGVTAAEGAVAAVGIEHGAAQGLTRVVHGHQVVIGPEAIDAAQGEGNALQVDGAGRAEEVVHADERDRGGLAGGTGVNRPGSAGGVVVDRVGDAGAGDDAGATAREAWVTGLGGVGLGGFVDVGADAEAVAIADVVGGADGDEVVVPDGGGDVGVRQVRGAVSGVGVERQGVGTGTAEDRSLNQGDKLVHEGTVEDAVGVGVTEQGDTAIGTGRQRGEVRAREATLIGDAHGDAQQARLVKEEVVFGGGVREQFRGAANDHEGGAAGVAGNDHLCAGRTGDIGRAAVAPGQRAVAVVGEAIGALVDDAADRDNVEAGDGLEGRDVTAVGRVDGQGLAAGAMGLTDLHNEVVARRAFGAQDEHAAGGDVYADTESATGAAVGLPGEGGSGEAQYAGLAGAVAGADGMDADTANGGGLLDIAVDVGTDGERCGGVDRR